MLRLGPAHLPWLAVLAALALLEGCDQPPPPPVQIQDVQARVVSLAPALTQMLVDMGKGDVLVGVAENDFAAPRQLPVVGNYTDLNLEALSAVRPTVVVTMAGKEGVPARLKDLAATRNFTVLAYPSPEKIDDITRMLVVDDLELRGIPNDKGITPGLGFALGAPLAAQRVKMRMLAQLANLREVTATAPRPKVLVVIGANPIMASGPKTVFDEMLAVAGATNAAAEAKVTAPTFDKEALLAAAPDVVVFLLPGAPPLQALDKDARLAELAKLPIPAVQNQRLVMINDPLAQLPSSSLPRIAALLAKAVHPGLAERIDRAMRAGEAAATAPATRPAAAATTLPASQPAKSQ